MSRNNLNQEKYGVSLPDSSAKQIVDGSIIGYDKFRSGASLDEDSSPEKGPSEFKTSSNTFKILFFIALGILVAIFLVYLGSIMGKNQQIRQEANMKNLKNPSDSQETKNNIQADTGRKDQKINDKKAEQNQQNNNPEFEENPSEKQNLQNPKQNQNTKNNQTKTNKPQKKQKEQTKKNQSNSKKPQTLSKPRKQKSSVPQIVYNKSIQNNIKNGVPKFKLRQTPRVKAEGKGDQKDLYEFTDSIDNVVQKSGISSTYRNKISEWTGIKQSEYQRAIRLMQVVHNVNYKGEFVFDHFNFYNSAEDKAKALLKILQQEKKYFDQKYEISKYAHDQIGICVYVPSYNNGENRLYLRNLDSIFQQQYQNYHIVYVNDASTDGTGEYVQKYMDDNQISDKKYDIINNDKNKQDTGNFYTVVREYCNQGQIMIFLDGQDSLVGRQVFSLLNAVYQKQKIALTYGQFLIVRENKIYSGLSRSFPMDYAGDGTFRKLRSFYTSHLKTAYVDVLRQIDIEDLQDEDGQFYQYGAEVAIMTPAIQLVGSRMKFLTEINYEHRFDSGFHEPHDEQREVQDEVWKKESSEQIEDMSFADNPKTIHYA